MKQSGDVNAKIISFLLSAACHYIGNTEWFVKGVITHTF